MKSLFFLLLLINFSFAYLEKASSNSKQDIVLPGVSGCGCAGSFPSCCTPEFMTYICDCTPKPECGDCPGMENMFVNIHDNMLKLAMKDAFNQQDLAQKAKIQVDLFQKAQEFAKEVGIQEMKAKQFARLLNEATRKAQFSRALMFQSASQIRVLSDQTIRALQPMKCLGTRCQIPTTMTTITETMPATPYFNIETNPLDVSSSEGLAFPTQYNFKQNNKLRGSN